MRDSVHGPGIDRQTIVSGIVDLSNYPESSVASVARNERMTRAGLPTANA
jgi:hypothetical protein